MPLCKKSKHLPTALSGGKTFMAKSKQNWPQRPKQWQQKMWLHLKLNWSWLKMHKHINIFIKATNTHGWSCCSLASPEANPKKDSASAYPQTPPLLNLRPYTKTALGSSLCNRLKFSRLNQQSTSITISEYNSCAWLRFSGWRDWLHFFFN